jgi:hypothetical protein
MGLGLSVVSALPQRGLLRRVPPPQRVIEELVAAAAIFAGRQPDPLGGWYWASPGEDTLHINLFSGEENVVLRVVDDRLECTAKTSSAGPGYHAHVLELLEHLGVQLELEWREEEEGGDETGFFKKRAFPELQLEMANWLRQVARQTRDQADRFTPPLLLALSTDFRPRSSALAVSQMGEWSRAWIERVAGAADTELLDLAGQFFPWWEEGVTARVLRGLALSRCWVDLRWMVPDDERERDLCRSVLECFTRARSLDPSVALPDEAIAELQALLAPAAEHRKPGPEGLGFRRRPMLRPLTGGWGIEVPGYFAEWLEDDGGTQVFSFGGRKVRGSSMSLESKRPMTPVEILGAMRANDGEAALPLNSPRLAGKYTCTRGEGDEWVLRASVAKSDGACIVSIEFPGEADRTWAENVAKTITAGAFGS